MRILGVFFAISESGIYFRESAYHAFGASAESYALPSELNTWQYHHTYYAFGAFVELCHGCKVSWILYSGHKYAFDAIVESYHECRVGRGLFVFVLWWYTPLLMRQLSLCAWSISPVVVFWVFSSLGWTAPIRPVLNLALNTWRRVAYAPCLIHIWIYKSCEDFSECFTRTFVHVCLEMPCRVDCVNEPFELQVELCCIHYEDL